MANSTQVYTSSGRYKTKLATFNRVSYTCSHSKLWHKIVLYRMPWLADWNEPDGKKRKLLELKTSLDNHF